MRRLFHLRASISLLLLSFLLVIGSARGEPIVLSVEGGPAVSFGGSVSTIIVASDPATISISVGGAGLPLFGPGPTVTRSYTFAPLGGGQGIFDPAYAAYFAESFGFGPPSVGATCGGVFVGTNPSCTEAIGPGLYNFSLSLEVEPNIRFSDPVSGSFEATVTLVSGGPIQVAPEPTSFVLFATGVGLLSAIARLRVPARISGAG